MLLFVSDNVRKIIYAGKFASETREFILSRFNVCHGSYKTWIYKTFNHILHCNWKGIRHDTNYVSYRSINWPSEDYWYKHISKHIQWQPFNDQALYQSVTSLQTLYRIMIGVNRTMATGEACQHRLRTHGLVPFLTWICSSCWDQPHPISIRHKTS